MINNNNNEKLKIELSEYSGKFSFKFIKYLNFLINKDCKEITDYLLIIIYIIFNPQKELNELIKYKYKLKIKFLSKYLLTEILLRNKIIEVSSKVKKLNLNKMIIAYNFYKKLDTDINKNDYLKIIYKYLEILFNYYDIFNDNKLIKSLKLEESKKVKQKIEIKQEEIKQLVINEEKQTKLKYSKNTSKNISNNISKNEIKKKKNLKQKNNKFNNFFLKKDNKKKNNEEEEKEEEPIKLSETKIEISKDVKKDVKKSEIVGKKIIKNPKEIEKEKEKANPTNKKYNKNIPKTFKSRHKNLRDKSNISINKSVNKLVIKDKSPELINPIPEIQVKEQQAENIIKNLIEDNEDNTNINNENLKIPFNTQNRLIKDSFEESDYFRVFRIYKNLKNQSSNKPINQGNDIDVKFKYSYNNHKFNNINGIKNEIKAKYLNMNFKNINNNKKHLLSKSKPKNNIPKNFYSVNLKNDEISNLKKELLNIKSKNNKLKHDIKIEERNKIEVEERKKVKNDINYQLGLENKNLVFFNENTIINESNNIILKNQILHKSRKFKTLGIFLDKDKLTKNDLIEINNKIRNERMNSIENSIKIKIESKKDIKLLVSKEKSIKNKRDTKFKQIDRDNNYSHQKQKVINQIKYLTEEYNFLKKLK